MNERIDLSRGMRLLVIAAALVVIVSGIHQAQSVLASILVAVFLSMLGTPPVLWLERKRIPTLVAVLLVVAAMVAILLAAGAIVGASVSGFSAELPAYQSRMQEKVSALQAYLATKGVRQLDRVLLEYLNPSSVMELTSRLLAGLGLALSNIVLILLTTTFILLEASSFPAKIRTVLGHPQQAFPQVTVFVADLERYMVIKTGISLATGVLVGTWLAILGVDFPVLWGFLAFLLDNVVEMKLMGRRLHLSTLVVFLSLTFWGSLLGLVGMILCIPLTMTAKFACENNEGTRWIAVLLGPEGANDPEPP